MKDNTQYVEGYYDCLNDVRKIIANRIEELELECEEVNLVIKDARKIGDLVINENNEHDETLGCEYYYFGLMLEGGLTRINARIDELNQLKGDGVVKDEG